VLYVYGFVPTPAVIPALRGIQNAELAAVPIGTLDAVASEYDGATIERSEASVLAHARVVDALAEANDGVLPARYGGLHADAAALREAVAGRPELARALDRVRGCVELGVRVLGEAPKPVAASSGRAYMSARLEERRSADRLADALHRPLAALARESSLTVGATPSLPVTGAYLVDRGAVGEFRKAVERLQADHPSVGIVCTGPWPPYSFAMERGAA
jgi:hypothetical protein